MISIEIDGDHIYGLDAQENRLMQFEVELGEWVEFVDGVVITDVEAWKQEVMVDAMAEAGVSTWEEYLQKKVVGDPEYDKTVRQTSYSDHLPMSFASEEGRIMERGRVEVDSQFLKENGFSEAEVILVAFDEASEPIEVLAGLYNANGDYVPILKRVISAGRIGDFSEIKSPDDLDALIGSMKAINLVSKLAWFKWVDINHPDSNWSKLEEIPFSNHYNNIMSRSAVERKAFELVLFADDGYVLGRTVEEIIRNKPPQFKGRNDYALVSLLAIMQDEKFNGSAGWLIPYEMGENRGSFFSK